VSETANGAKIVQAYRDHRPYLVDLAFRMLGDIGAAEDAVQDAFTRLLAADVGEITDEMILVTGPPRRLPQPFPGYTGTTRREANRPPVCRMCGPLLTASSCRAYTAGLG
jgi:hypothetical protein